MKEATRFLWLGLGLLAGIAGMAAFQRAPTPALAGNDRCEDYILVTGQIRLGVNVEGDCIWLLDYKAGKLLGTIVDRNLGKVRTWAHVDLVREFDIPPKQNVHFLMTYGAQIKGQTTVYLTEINSGKFGVYTMTPALDGSNSILIRCHDRTYFRKPASE